MAERLRVLCVDPDPAGLQALEDALRAEFFVATAATADAALEQAKGGGFHVVCADSRLKDRTGLALLKSIAAVDSRPELVLLTGANSLFMSREDLLSGQICYVFKPVQRDALLETVRRLASVAASK